MLAVALRKLAANGGPMQPPVVGAEPMIPIAARETDRRRLTCPSGSVVRLLHLVRNGVLKVWRRAPADMLIDEFITH